ncbi:MAG: hypothetical protein WDM90_08490 [Ferruginibacter sp.]
MKSLLTAVIFVFGNTIHSNSRQKSITTFKPVMNAYYEVKNG